MNNFQFIMTPSDIFGVIMMVVVAPLLFLWAVFDVFVLQPRRKRAEERRKGARR